MAFHGRLVTFASTLTHLLFMCFDKWNLLTIFFYWTFSPRVPISLCLCLLLFHHLSLFSFPWQPLIGVHVRKSFSCLAVIVERRCSLNYWLSRISWMQKLYASNFKRSYENHRIVCNIYSVIAWEKNKIYPLLERIQKQEKLHQTDVIFL